MKGVDMRSPGTRRRTLALILLLTGAAWSGCSKKEIKLELTREIDPPKIESALFDPSGTLETGKPISVRVVLQGDSGLDASFDLRGAVSGENRAMTEERPGVYVGSFEVAGGLEGEVRAVGRLMHTASGTNSTRPVDGALTLMKPAVPPPPAPPTVCTAEMKADLDRRLEEIVVLFDFTLALLTEETRSTLEGHRAAITSNPLCNFFVLGHADIVGSPRQNFDLGEARAQAVARFLADALDIPRARMVARSLGEEHPLNDGPVGDARRRSRRVELRAVDPY
jgi:outer membrane protein OmpA-like peptidoglycan-associated protein